MPNWNVHLEVAKRLNKKIKFTGLDLEQFLLGNILPDINNGYIIKDISKIISHKVTHYDEKLISSYQNFYSKYKNTLKVEPILLGYYIHLYTDYLWNNDFYKRIKKYDIYDNYSSKELRTLKQNDFKKFNNFFVDNKVEFSDYDIILQKTKMIDKISIEKKDLINLTNYLEKEIKFDVEYKFYTFEQLENLLDNSIETIENFIDKNI